ncbi:ABC transporter permease [Rhodoligotrophos defluvii]|uniref:ABC transporter permease n=1 Tax=Rhodoligotrophos defluvii TaxID=2561934 RepID=UPI0010C9B696|nr:ABC transporter permease [Rhodoligotrophos defluvii]
MVVQPLPKGRESRISSLFWSAPSSFRIGAVILAIQILLAVLGPWIAPFAQQQMMTGRPVQGPDLLHWFGTDQLGRDVFSRTLHGGWIVIVLSASGTILGVALGSVIGLTCGYVRGWLDEIVMRLVEAVLSIPFLVLALLAVSMAGPELSGSPLLVVLVVALIYTPRIARMARAAALDIVTRDYVTAARLRGEPTYSVVVREMLPNAMGVLLVEFAVRAGYAPVLIGTLGFLGFGMRPPTPEWGLMISEYRNLLTVQPMAVFGPGLMLASLVIGLNFFTEGLARVLGRSPMRGSPLRGAA